MEATMAYGFLIPIVSATAGNSEDGSLIGGVLDSNFAGAFTDVRLAATVTAYRKDVTGSAFTFTNLSTPLNDDTVSDVEPFGSNAQMSAGDKFYISCDHKIKAMYFRVATAGLWTGTMAFKCSTDGITENHTITTITDASNGFRAGTGIYKITPTLPANILAFSPVPGDVPSKQWVVLEPSVSAVTTAPVLTRAWIEHEDGGITYIDLSTGINSDIMGAGGTNHPPSFFPAVGSSTLYAFADVPKGMVRRVFQKAADVRTRAIEYLASDNTWKPLVGLTDPSNDFKNGPATLTSKIITAITAANPCVITSTAHGLSVNDKVHITDVVGMTQINGQNLRITAVTANTITVNINSTGYTAYASGGKATPFIEYLVNIVSPSDWTSKSQTFTTGTGNVTSTGYWLRERTTVVSVVGPAQAVYANVEAKQFGNANTSGIVVPVATTLRAVSIEEPLSESGTGTVEIQLSNLTKGTSTTFTIPSSPSYPLNVDFTDLALVANDKFGMFYVSGTKTFTSVPVTLHD